MMSNKRKRATQDWGKDAHVSVETAVSSLSRKWSASMCVLCAAVFAHVGLFPIQPQLPTLVYVFVVDVRHLN